VTHLYENLGGAAKEWFEYLPWNVLQNYNEVLQRLRENFQQSGSNYADF